MGNTLKCIAPFEQMLEQYRARLMAVKDLIAELKSDCPDNKDYVRLNTKQSEYRSIIVELESALAQAKS